MNPTRRGRNAKTILAAVVLSALFAAVATQIYGIIVPSANALPLLALFFAVGICAAWATVRLDARWQRAERNPKSARVEQPAATGERETGTVKWFDRSKGYGFVVRPSGEEIFVHQRSLRRQGESRPAINDGQTVNYIAVEGDRGWQAEDVVAE